MTTIVPPRQKLQASQLLSAQTRRAIARAQTRREQVEARRVELGIDAEDVDRLNAFYNQWRYPSIISGFKRRYKVETCTRVISGILADIVRPAGGEAPEHSKRRLINFHGGGFYCGARNHALMESIPMAALLRVETIGVDYRMAPSHRYPAATEDALKVYRAILDETDPGNVGLIGCSAGALLVSQAIAAFQRAGLPLPGAVGLFFCGATFWSDGDTGAAEPNAQSRAPLWRENLYLSGASHEDEYLFPLKSNHLLSAFPPALLFSSTQDVALSSVVATHSRLVNLQRVADLHVWEGLPHAFFYNPSLPETAEAYRVATQFFNRHLGS